MHDWRPRGAEWCVAYLLVRAGIDLGAQMTQFSLQEGDDLLVALLRLPRLGLGQHREPILGPELRVLVRESRQFLGRSSARVRVDPHVYN